MIQAIMKFYAAMEIILVGTMLEERDARLVFVVYTKTASSRSNEDWWFAKNLSHINICINLAISMFCLVMCS